MQDKKVKIGRNSPCTCGSGKKYKHCCGMVADVIHAPAAADAVRFNRQIAYLGSVGEKRAKFCREYIARKQQINNLIARRQAEAAAVSGKEIACSPGCTACCSALVKCSLQEVEAIIYYLYLHDAALASFLNAFPSWLAEAYRHREILDKTEAVLSKPLAEQASGIQSLTAKAGSGKPAYWGVLDIPCPFLKDRRCSIYDVRPLACVNLAATGVCGRDAGANPFWLKLNPDIEPPFWDSRLHGYFTGLMPNLVYKILVGGFMALAQIPGLETLLDEFHNDPDVQRF